MKRIFFLLAIPVFSFSLNYEVRFIGLEDKAALNSILEASELVLLQKRPPPSINGLKYRADADIPILLKVLKSYAYYDAKISTKIIDENQDIIVNVLIDPGPQFTLQSYQVYSGDCKELFHEDQCSTLTSEKLGLKIGSAALSQNIINAELNVLEELSKCAHPLAFIDKRRITVDMKSNQVMADCCVQTGPFAKFGPTSVFGTENVKPEFIQNKIFWDEGCPYDSDLVEKTQKKLLSSELFSSVLITHSENVDSMGYLPMKIRVSEANYKKITLGAFYATVNGPGGNITWTNRNFRNMGEIVTCKLEYAQKSYTGQLLYKKPDFLRFNQTYKAYAEANHENITAYKSQLYRLANYIERKTSSYGFFSLGLKMDYIQVRNSATNGNYFLLGAPVFGKYEYIDDALDPKSGFSLAYSITPYQSLESKNIQFAKQRITGTCYIPMIPSKNLSLALRFQAGSIAGTSRNNVPLPKLFLGGSEDELRGYKYQTVSPLKGHKPLGGRSAIYATAEIRIKIFDKIGIVPFFDTGTVTNRQMPVLTTTWLNSVGLGLRYFAFFGPLRFDIGFPLNRREGIDSFYQIYASVGQSF